MENKSFNLAICQMESDFRHDDIEKNKSENIAHAEQMIEEAAKNGADVVVLPEMWNSIYSNEKMPIYSENAGGMIDRALSAAAKKHGIYLFGGSNPELDGEKVYNSAPVFDRDGNLIGRHRKAHLFDVDIPGKITFMESDSLTAGDAVTTVDTEWCRIGLGICYDIRFPEFTRAMACSGAELIILPAAFNMHTGAAHWSASIKMRAVDNQVYFAGAAPARKEDSAYVTYAHSCICNPWGDVVASAGHKEEIIYGNIDLEYLMRVREELPLIKHLRHELYNHVRGV